MDEEKKEQEEKAVKPEVVEEQKAEENKEESKGMSIASLVLGIVSLVMLCIWYISIPCSILAIIFGILGRKKGGKGMGTAGLVLGIITVAFLIIIYILFVAGIATMFSVLKDIDYNKIDSENILQAINSINANVSL